MKFLYITLALIILFFNQIVNLPVGYFDLDEYFIVPLIKQNNFLKIELHINETNSTYHSVIDINSRLYWYQTAFTPLNQSNPFKLERCIPPDDLILNRTVIFSNSTYVINNMPIAEYTSLNDCCYESSIGFPYGFEPNTFTIFESLDKNYYIKRIGIYYSTRNNSGFLRIGYQDIHDDSIKNRVSICPVKKFNKQWNCQLTAIIIGSMEEIDKTPEGFISYLKTSVSNLYVVNRPIVFDIIQHLLLVSKDFYDYLQVQVFKPYLNTGYCINKEIEALRIITCDKSVMSTFPTIHFVLDNNLISLPAEYLFEENNGNDTKDQDYLFLMAYDIRNDHHWSVGNMILERFGLVLDMHLELIYLFHKEDLRKRVKIIGLEATLDRKTLNQIENVFSFMIMIGIVGIMMIIITLFRQKEIWTYSFNKTTPTQGSTENETKTKDNKRF